MDTDVEVPVRRVIKLKAPIGNAFSDLGMVAQEDAISGLDKGSQLCGHEF